MARASDSSHFQRHGLAWALAISIVLHAALAGLLPAFHFDPPPPRQQELKIELLPPKPPEARVEEVAPPAPPEPEPAPPKPEPKPEPPPVKRPAPPKPVEQPTPPRTPDIPPPRAEPPSVPPVITAAPKPEAPPPTVTAPPPPPPEPPKPIGPSDAEIDAAQQAYGNALSREIAKHKRYPNVARMRGWEGKVTLLLEIDASGKIVAVSVAEPSEREVFNVEAQEMVKRMVQPQIPDTLRGRSFTVRVPINFRLE